MAFSVVSINVTIIVENLKVELRSKVFISSKTHTESFWVSNFSKFIVQKFFFTLNLEYIERPTFVIFPLNAQQLRGFASPIQGRVWEEGWEVSTTSSVVFQWWLLVVIVPIIVLFQ